jgi:4-amino-4-deoxy-L-arabinose transferase-like glycosyltransferase
MGFLKSNSFRQKFVKTLNNLLDTEAVVDEQPTPNIRPASFQRLKNTFVGDLIESIASIKFSIGHIAGLLAIWFLVLGGIGLQRNNGQAQLDFWSVMQLFAIGGILLGVAIWKLRPANEFSTFSRNLRPSGSPVRWPLVAAGFIALAIVAEINRRAFLPDLTLPMSVQTILFVGGFLAVATGLGGFNGFGSFSLQKSSLRKLLTPTTIALILITLAGFLVRIWQLSDANHILSTDEANGMRAMLDSRTNSYAGILQPMGSVTAFPLIYVHISDIFTRIFGANYAAFRLTSAVFGTLGILAIYLLGTEIHDKKTGLLAAALFAFFPPWIHFSRLALSNAGDPVMGTLALAFIIRAIRTNSQGSYVLAGLFLGLTCLFHEGGMLLFFGLFITWFAFIFILYRPFKHRRGLLLMLIMILAIMLPYLYVHNSPEYVDWYKWKSEGTLQNVLEDFKTKPFPEALGNYWDKYLSVTFSHVFYSPEDSVMFYDGRTPVLLWFIVPFCALGLFYILWHRNLVSLLFLIWVAGDLVGGSLVIYPSWTPRIVPLFPLLMICTAIGLRYPLEMLWSSARAKQVIFAAACVVTAIICIAHTTFYFTDFLPWNNLATRYERDPIEAFDRTLKYPGRSKLIYINDGSILNSWLDALVAFYNVERPYEQWNPKEVTKEQIEALPKNTRIFFFVNPNDMDTPSLIQATLPVEGPFYKELDSLPEELQYVMYVYNTP